MRRQETRFARTAEFAQATLLPGVRLRRRRGRCHNDRQFKQSALPLLWVHTRVIEINETLQISPGVLFLAFLHKFLHFFNDISFIGSPS